MKTAMMTMMMTMTMIMIEIIVIIYNDEEGGNADENNDGDVTKEAKVQSGRCLKSGIPLFLCVCDKIA